MEIAERGYIFDFIETDGSIKNKVLVVSDDSRKKDNIVSIIMLSSSSKPVSDMVDITIENQGWFIHAGLVTFCRRERLGRKYGKIKDKKMQEITELMTEQLGISRKPKIDYEAMYNSLLDKVIERGFAV